MEENKTNIGDLDLSPEETKIEVPLKEKTPKKEKEIYKEDDTPVSCLRAERVVVRWIPQESGLIQDPNHVFYGKMAENSYRKYTVPKLSSTKSYVNILTNDEKASLEEAMGMEFNSLSIHRKVDNYWDNYTVTLGKGDTTLDLSDPVGYIDYKVLLANKDFIAPSMEVWKNTPKATYQYVLIRENEEVKEKSKEFNNTMEAYMELGKIRDDFDVMRYVVEIWSGRPVAKNTAISFLQGKVGELIKVNPNLFLDIVTDKYLPIKVLIGKGVEAGFISNRGGYYYLKDTSAALAETGQDPTFDIAAKYLSSPKNQTLKLSLEVKIKSQKE